MLSENIKNIRKNKGFTQEEIAAKLHVTRQTISKWEKGLSVPDAELLTAMSEIFEVSISDLLGTETVENMEKNDIADQLSRINEHLAVRNRTSNRVIKAVLGALLVAVILFVIKTNHRIVIIEPNSANPNVPDNVAVVADDSAGDYAEDEELGSGNELVLQDHLGKVTYDLPVTYDGKGRFKRNGEGFIGVSTKNKIIDKSYRAIDFWTELSFEEYTVEMCDFEFFKGEYAEYIVGETNKKYEFPHDLPECIDEIIIATNNEGYADDGGYVPGDFFAAIFTVKGVENKRYCIRATGDAPVEDGEYVLASVGVDESLEDEYSDIPANQLDFVAVTEDHLGKLKYVVPSNGSRYELQKTDSSEEDGKNRISTKVYRENDLRFELTVEALTNEKTHFDDFKKEHAEDIVGDTNKIYEYPWTIPQCVDEIVIATDKEGYLDDGGYVPGTFFSAIFTVKGVEDRIFKVTSTGEGSADDAEYLLAYLEVDDSLEEEYNINKSN